MEHRVETNLSEEANAALQRMLIMDLQVYFVPWGSLWSIRCEDKNIHTSSFAMEIAETKEDAFWLLWTRIGMNTGVWY
jgi:hypothetical protein